MEKFLLDNQGEIFAWIYLAGFGVLALWESLSPRREPCASLRVRWINNIILFVISVSFSRLLLPLTCIAAAIISTEQGWGVFGFITAPLWIQIIVLILLLDFTRYSCHFLFHRIPLLWRLHRIHHTDPDFDVSTSFRFHPLEAFLQATTNASLVMFLGVEPIAVVVFESIVLAQNFFTHGNVRLGERLDAVMRKVVVTPDVHRIHHSVFEKEYDSNYGLVFTWWDRLFDTYVAVPKSGHEQMQLGLVGYEGREHLRIDRMLLDPVLSIRSRGSRETV